MKGPWSEEEEAVIRDEVARVGAHNVKWADVALRLPGRIGKQCRERWFNLLDPGIKRGAFEPEEDRAIFEAQHVLGEFVGRTRVAYAACRLGTCAPAACA
jgi:hypothetical protein